MTFEAWLSLGVQNGWITEPFCDTHDGVPMTEEEMQMWEDGSDPCHHCVRLISDADRDELASKGNRS